MTFYYRRGLAETQTPWQRPSPNRILKFIDRAIPVIESLGLELWLTGRSLRDPYNTWDVDCYIIGQIDNKSNEDIQHALIDEGFRQGILVDPYWMSNHSPAYKQDNRWFQTASKIYLLYPVIWQNKDRSTTIDHRGQTHIPQITEYLVEFAYGNQPLKEKHVEYLNTHKDFQRINARDYPLTIDATANTLNMLSTSGNHNV